MSQDYAAFRRLDRAPEDVFELVSDIERYPDFIKYITALRVSKRRTDGDVMRCEAEARIRYKFITERFTTSVETNARDLTIDVGLISGPFSALANRWRFHRLSDGSTLVDFWIRAAFRNPILQGFFDANRMRAVRSLMGQFEKAAQARYEPVGGEASALDEEIQALIDKLERD